MTDAILDLTGKAPAEEAAAPAEDADAHASSKAYAGPVVISSFVGDTRYAGTGRTTGGQAGCKGTIS